MCAHWGFCPDVHSNSFWREYLAYVEEAGPRTWKEQGHSSLLQKQWHIFSHTSHLDICITFLNCFQFSSVAQSCPTLCNPMNCSTPGLPIHHQLPESTQTPVHWSVMPYNHLILCCPLLLQPSVFPSIRVFSNESALCIRWPKY